MQCNQQQNSATWHIDLPPSLQSPLVPAYNVGVQMRARLCVLPRQQKEFAFTRTSTWRIFACLLEMFAHDTRRLADGRNARLDSELGELEDACVCRHTKLHILYIIAALRLFVCWRICLRKRRSGYDDEV